MNACNGCLVASIATDDPTFGARAAEQLQAFKVGINKPRTRGDRDELFGGIGASWKGAFVGGDLLVHAVTVGPRATASGCTATSRTTPATRTAERPQVQLDLGPALAEVQAAVPAPGPA